MHISSLYLSTYKPERPIDGHMEVVEGDTKLCIEFTEEESLRIQDIAVEAYVRMQKEMAQTILNSTPALVCLPAPTPPIQEAEFTEVEASDDLPF